MSVVIKDTGNFQATSVAARCECCGIVKAGFQFTYLGHYVTICTECLFEVISLRAAMKDKDI
jgi:hypothetical protein